MDNLIWDSKAGLHWHLLPEELEQTYLLSGSYVSQGSTGAASESQWLDLLECHFYLCLTTLHDKEAKLMLQRLLDRFGNNGESLRIQKMVRAYRHHVGEIQKGPETPRSEYVDSYYDAKEAAIAHKLEDTGKYVEALVDLVDRDPADAEAWSELAAMYAGTGNFEQAVQALRHVLVLVPRAYNIWARIGELRHLQAVTLSGGIDGATAQLEESVECMCQAVELCPVYVRGWCGLFVYSTKLSQWPKADRKKYEALRLKAKQKLEQMDDVWAKKVLNGS